MTVNGQSGGILPVLVFGAGTDYALLLVSRYREELRRHEDKHEAMRARAAHRRPGDPRLGPDGDRRRCSCSSLAEVNGTAGLGPIGAMGILVAMTSCSPCCPPRSRSAAAARSGRSCRTGRRGTASSGRVSGRLARFSHQHRRDARLLAPGRRPRRRARRGRVAVVDHAACCSCCAPGSLDLDTGLTHGNSFRGEVESVKGQELLAAHFPAGANVPGDGDRARRARKVAARSPRRSSGRRAAVADVGRPRAGRRRAPLLSLQLKADPYSTRGLRPDPAPARGRQAGRRRRRPDRRRRRAESYDLPASRRRATTR